MSRTNAVEKVESDTVPAMPHVGLSQAIAPVNGQGIVSVNGAAPVAPVVPLGSLPPYLTLQQVSDHILPVPVKTLRWWIFKNRDNFNGECCTRRSGKIFIIKANLEKWMRRGQR